MTGAEPGTSIVDIGCGSLGLRALEPDLDITGVDLAPRPDYPGPFVQADATERLPFADGQFDLAYSSSVIEHVPRERRAAFASELRRVARGWFVQTPARSFPIEPHALLPFAHWLPPALRRPYWRLGAQAQRPAPDVDDGHAGLGAGHGEELLVTPSARVRRERAEDARPQAPASGRVDVL